MDVTRTMIYIAICMHLMTPFPGFWVSLSSVTLEVSLFSHFFDSPFALLIVTRPSPSLPAIAPNYARISLADVSSARSVSFEVAHGARHSKRTKNVK